MGRICSIRAQVFHSVPQTPRICSKYIRVYSHTKGPEPAYTV
jgi:hypothetical protein